MSAPAGVEPTGERLAWIYYRVRPELLAQLSAVLVRDVPLLRTSPLARCGQSGAVG